MRLRPSKSVGAVNKPAVECITEATAQRSDVIDLVGHGRALHRAPSKDQAIRARLKIRERNIGFGAEKQPGRQNVIIASLQAAIETAERIADTNGIGIRQRAGPPTPTKADMPTDIEASPVVGGRNSVLNRRSLRRHDVVGRRAARGRQRHADNSPEDERLHRDPNPASLPIFNSHCDIHFVAKDICFAAISPCAIIYSPDIRI